MLGRQQLYIYPTPPPPPAHLRSNFISPNRQSLNQRTRAKSIHALTPSTFKPMTPKTLRHPSSTAAQSTRMAFFQPSKDINVVKSLFLDQQSVLRKLEQQTEALEMEKEGVIANNKEEYQRIMQKLMEMRKLCNKRRQDIEALRTDLRQLELNNSYRQVKNFSSRRESDRLHRPHQHDDPFKNSSGFLSTSYSTKPAYNRLGHSINF